MCIILVRYLKQWRNIGLTHWGRDKWTPFADDIFNSIFLNENVWTPIKISLKFVPKGLIINIPALDQIMAWRRPGDKPLSEPMMVSLLTHICVTRPQWVNDLFMPVAIYEMGVFKMGFPVGRRGKMPYVNESLDAAMDTNYGTVQFVVWFIGIHNACPAKTFIFLYCTLVDIML